MWITETDLTAEIEDAVLDATVLMTVLWHARGETE